MSRILVVDDDTLWRECLCDLLMQHGHEVLHADNGMKCLEILEQEAADLVLIDLFMPVKDGIATIVDIRSLFPGLRIIAMSGGASLLDGKRYLNMAQVLGASKVLPKPMPGDSLLQAINELQPQGV